MPVLNDLTPEEEAAFIEHGVQPAGPGGEPVADEGDPPAGDPPAGDPPAGDERPRDAQGRFLPQAGDPPVDPNAPPVDPNAPPAPAPTQQPRMVPHEALHAERQRSANAIAQAQLLQTRMNALLAARRPDQPQMPDLNQDPVAYIQTLEERVRAFEAVQQEEAQNQEVEQALNQDEQLFAQQYPDYDQASDHYVQSRARELLAVGQSPQQAQQILREEARQIATTAWQRGISAAQMIYQLASARGYNPGMPSREPAPALTPPAPAPAARGGPAPADLVRSVNAGQAASRSLSGGTGGAPVAQLNAEAILNMSDEEFEEHLALGTKGANERFAHIG